MERYQILKAIGDGTYGSVLQAVNKKTKEMVAIKKMKRKVYNWEECEMNPEIQSLLKLNHPNIVRLFEVIKEKNELFFVFEFLDKNIYQMTKDRRKFLPETRIRNVMYQILHGLAHMHKQGYFHRDLKPENLLVAQDNIVKLADFGLARKISSRPPYTDYVSTRWYRAPEVLLRSTSYGPAIDVWALGCIMAELYTFRPLFPGASEPDQIAKICAVMGTPLQHVWPDGMKLAEKMKFKFPQCVATPLSQLVPNASREALQLMQAMMAYDPRQRPTCAAALQSAYFQVGQSVTPGLGGLGGLGLDPKDVNPALLFGPHNGDAPSDSSNDPAKSVRVGEEDFSSVEVKKINLRDICRYRPGVPFAQEPASVPSRATTGAGASSRKK